MALNKFMHPRNVYKDNPPDFVELSELFPSFKKHVKFSKSKRPFVNFRDPQVVRGLSTCLLEKDFNLKLELPDDRLAPTIPLRLNYILWLEDLLNCLPEKKSCCILDIGCGSSCVYPLLGTRVNKNWTFIATEVDEKNFNFASANVKRNSLCERINLIRVRDENFILDAGEFDACMCNPPFFTSLDQMKVAEGRPVANSSCSGNEIELIGGDFVFAKRIFTESLKIKEKSSWYTIMLGKKSSFLQMKKLLRNDEVKTVTTTEFCQGRTMRWGIAWSFAAISVSSLNETNIKQPRKQLTFSSKFTSMSETIEAVTGTLHELKIEFSQKGLQFQLIGDISKLIPNRRARRQMKRGNEECCDAPSTKMPKHDIENDYVAQSDVFVVLEICSVKFGPAKINLTSSVVDYSDQLNRIFMYFKSRI